MQNYSAFVGKVQRLFPGQSLCTLSMKAEYFCIVNFACSFAQ